MDADSILAYGIDLGGDPPVGWLLHDLDPQGNPTTPWWDPADSYQDFCEAGDEQLKRARAEQEDPLAPGVQLIPYGTSERTSYLLVAHSVKVDLGCMEVLGEETSLDGRRNDDWDRQLAEACRILGIRPQQERAAWILSSAWWY